MTLASDSGYSYRDLETLARIVVREKDIDEEMAETIASFSKNMKLYQQKLDLPRYLEANFAGLMVDAAEAMPTAPEYLFTV